MKSDLECIPCFLRQALQAARMATADERIQHQALQRAAAAIAVFPLTGSPIEFGRALHRTIRALTLSADPYATVKKDSNNQALALYPSLRQLVLESPNPLLVAIRLAAAGNVIDFGANPQFDLGQSIAEGLTSEFSNSDYEQLRARLGELRRVLYIGDNAGEIVFDKLLVEQLVERGLQVTFAVRGGPVLNDVTVEDARAVGMDSMAEVISNGDISPGTILHHCSPAFRDRFRDAELIIAKGQGNYEGLAGANGPLFFLLKVKCSVVAQRLGAAVGDVVLRANSGRPRAARLGACGTYHAPRR